MSKKLVSSKNHHLLTNNIPFSIVAEDVKTCNNFSQPTFLANIMENTMGFIELKSLPELEIAPGINAHVVTADTISVLHVRIDEGALLPEHSHYHEQVINVVEGELELTVQGKNYNLMPGNVMILEPNVVHSGRAIKACKVVDIFHPIRKDFVGANFGGYPDEK